MFLTRFTPALAFVLALIPAVFSFWIGRTLRGHADDPALPELLLERSQRTLKVGATAAACMLVITGGNAAWGIPLMLFALLVASFPARRHIVGETWSLGTFLWYTAKSTFGGFGFWFLLAYTPTIIVAIGADRWELAAAVGVSLAVVLAVWEHYYPRAWLRLHEATPLTRADLTERFADIVARSGVAAPDVFRIGAPGSRFTNAIALPSYRRAAVAMSDNLLEVLGPDEIAGVFAHELAHIEHFTRRRLRALRVFNLALIAGAVLIPLIALRASSAAASIASWAFPLAVLIALAARAARSQQHETESDLRAAALCGDPEAVVRGLTKVYLHARIPRRWAADFERVASHPSLVRRIQAIRAGGEAAVASLGAPTIFESSDEGKFVALDDTRAYWFDGVPAGTARELPAFREAATSYRTVAYSDLIELRVTTSGTTRALRAADRSGQAWSIPLRPADISAVQGALDVIDVRLARDTGQHPGHLPEVVLTVLLVLGVLSGQIGLLFLPAGIALFKRNAAALAAAGAIAVGDAVFAFLAGDGGGSWLAVTELGFARVALAGLGVVGALAIWLAFSRVRRQRLQSGVPLTVAVLAVTSLIIFATAATTLSEGVLGHLASDSVVTTLAISLLGLGAALLVLPRRSSRWAGVATMGAALALGGVAVAGTPLFAPKSDLEWRDARATVLASVPLSENAYEVRLSPEATRFAVLEMRGGRRGMAMGPKGITVGSASGVRREMHAIEATFLDEEHLVVLGMVGAERDSMELRVEHVDTSAVVWRDTMPLLETPRLSVDAAGRTWSVIGNDTETEGVVVFGGSFDSSAVSPRRWVLADSFAIAQPWAFRGGSTVLAPTFDYSGAEKFGLAQLFIGVSPMRAVLWLMTEREARPLGTVRGFAQCGQPDAEGESLCLVRRGMRAELWSVGSDGTLSLAGTMGEPLMSLAMVGPGQRLGTATMSGEILLVDAAARTGVRLHVPKDSAAVRSVRFTPGVAAAIRTTGKSSKLTIYRYEVPKGG